MKSLVVASSASTWRCRSRPRLLVDAEGGAKGGDRLRHGGGCLAGDLALGMVLVVGLDELGELVLGLLGVRAGRAEQQGLQVAEQVLAGLLGDLAVSDVGLQVTDERGGCRGGRGESWGGGRLYR